MESNTAQRPANPTGPPEHNTQKSFGHSHRVHKPSVDALWLQSRRETGEPRATVASQSRVDETTSGRDQTDGERCGEGRVRTCRVRSHSLIPKAGLAPGWRRVGAGLAFGWRSVGARHHRGAHMPAVERKAAELLYADVRLSATCPTTCHAKSAFEDPRQLEPKPQQRGPNANQDHTSVPRGTSPSAKNRCLKTPLSDQQKSPLSPSR